MNANKAIAIVLLVFSFSDLTSQIYSYRILSAEDGLPSNAVNDLLIDRKGFLWIATDYGVSRYNGIEFENYSTKEGLTENDVHYMYEDSLNRIWLSPFNGKLCYWQGGKIVNQLQDTSLGMMQTQIIKKEFLEESWGELWIRHKENSIVMYQRRDSERTFEKLNKGQDKIKIVGIDRASISIQSRYGRFKLSEEGIDTIGLMPPGLSSPQVFNKDTFYIRNHDHAVVKVNNGNREVIFKPDAEMTPTDLPLIIPSKLGGFWYMSDQSGTVYFQFKDDSIIISELLKEIHVKDIVDTRQGDIFFATDYGVYILDNLETKILSNENISAIESDKDGFLCGTYEGRVFHIAEQDKILYERRGKEKVLSLLGAPENLVGFKDGLIDFNQKKKVYEGSARFIKRVNNSIVIGSSNALVVMDKSYNVKRRIPLVQPTCAMVNDGTLWVGTNSGVFAYEDSTIRQVDNRHPYFSNSVSCISTHKYFDLIIGTNGNGIFCYSKSDSNLVIKTGNGLSDNRINYIHIDSEGIVWVASGFGLNRIEFKDRKNYVIRKYFVENGLISNNVTAVYREGNEVYVTSDKGVSTVAVDAPEIRLNPKIYLTQVRINGEIVPTEPFMSLSHNSNDIEVEFKGVGLNSSTGIKYLYQLRSFNRKWFDIQFDQRDPGKIEDMRPIGSLTENWYETEYPKQRFPSLPPAFYVLRIKSVAYGGKESLDDAILYFRIKKRFDQTVFFRITVGIFFILIMAFIILTIRRTIRSREAAKTEINKKMAQLEMKALQARMNPHFIYNSLNAVNEFISENDPRSAHIYLSKFAQLIRKILEQSGRESISLQEELDTLNIYLELEKNRYREKFNYEVNIDEKLDPYEEDIPSMIIQPFVENAIRHGLVHKKNKGKLLISFLSKNGSLKVVIEDDGIGIKKSTELKKDAKHKHKSLGLSLTEERLKVYNDANMTKKASVKIIDLYDENGTPNGTRVEIIFPN